jgi:MFS family permease
MSNRWTVLALLFLVRATMGFQFQSVPAVGPLFLAGFAVSAADLGLLIGLYHAPGIALALPGGRIGQRFGDVPAVAVGLALMAAGSIVMATSASWGLQIAGRLIAGTGALLLNVLMSKMVTDWFAGREIATAMGVFVNSWPFGIAIGLVAFPMLAAAGGLLLVHGSAAAVLVVALAALVTLYRPPGGNQTAAAATGATMPGSAVLAAILVAGCVWGLYNAALGVVFGFGPLMLTERGWSLAAAGSATSLVLWLVSVSVPAGGIIADRTGRLLSVLLTSCLLFAVGLTAAAATSAIVASFVLVGVLGELAAGPIMSLPSRVLAPADRAVGMGLFFTIFYLVQTLGPWIAGRLTSATGTSSAAFLTGAGFLVAAMLLVAVFLRLENSARAGTAAAGRP